MDRDLYIFQPPPGTQRDEKYDRILEVRFATLFRSIHSPLPVADDAKSHITQMGVAYTLEELASHVEKEPREDDLPRTMTVFIEEFRRKTKSGLVPLQDAQTKILETFADLVKDWPLIHPGLPGLQRSTRVPYPSPLCGVYAAARGEKPGVRAMMAAATASGFLHLSEVGLSEAALARASDQLAKLSPDDPLYKIATTAVTDIRHDFFRQAGKMEEANEARSNCLSTSLATRSPASLQESGSSQAEL